MRQLSTRDQMTQKFTTIGHRTAFNSEQCPYHIVSYKRNRNDIIPFFNMHYNRNKGSVVFFFNFILKIVCNDNAISSYPSVYIYTDSAYLILIDSLNSYAVLHLILPSPFTSFSSLWMIPCGMKGCTSSPPCEVPTAHS